VVDAVGAGDSSTPVSCTHGRAVAIEQALACGNLAGAWSTTASGGTSAFREPHSLRALEAALAESYPHNQSLKLPEQSAEGIGYIQS